MQEILEFMLSLLLSAKEFESRYDMDPSQVKGYNLSFLCKFSGLGLSLVIGDKINTHTPLWISTANNTAAAATLRQEEMSPEISVINCKNILQGGWVGGDEKNGVWKAVLSSMGTCGLTWIYRLARTPVEAVRSFCDEGKDGHLLIKASFVCRRRSVHDWQLNSLWPWILTSFISKKKYLSFMSLVFTASGLVDFHRKTVK